MVLMRVRYVFLKYSRPTREKVSDTRTGETHYGGILLEESTKIELLLPGKLWDNTAPKFIFAPLSSPIGYVRCKPCSWLNLCRAYGRQNKIRYCCSSFNFQLTKWSSLQLLKKLKLLRIFYFSLFGTECTLA